MRQPRMAPTVTEYCLSWAINLGRDFSGADRQFREHREVYGTAGNRRAYPLYGAAVGQIGFVNLGRSLVPLLLSFGCTICALDLLLPGIEPRKHGVHSASFDDVIGKSRFLFLLAGVTAEKTGFPDREALSRIRDDASVVLASRAEITDFDAFLALAAAGRFRAAVDVFPEEPVPSSSVARTTPNVLFTANFAGGLDASCARTQDMMIEDISRILRSQPPRAMQRADPIRAGQLQSR